MSLESIIYLDNSATTKPCKQSVEAVNKCLLENWGNPSSLHELGMEAETALEDARKTVAHSLNCAPKEIYFVGSGTEANNTAILGAARRRKKRGNRVITTAVEPPSVLETVKVLESEGFEVVRLKPDKSGKINEQELFNAIDEKTVLVSIMLVNNESGAIMPVEVAARAIKEKKSPAVLHCDAVQGYGKLPIDVKKLGVDMRSARGHKIHAPNGIGFLYIKEGVTIDPLITGGGQEKGMRSGTESLPLICGFAAAVGALPNLKSQLKIQEELVAYAKEKFKESGIITVNSPDDALPYIINISVVGYRSETLLHFLESKSIFVSSGSACAKGHGSYVLNEMGLDRSRVDSALRISFSRYNTKEEIDSLVDAIKQAAGKLRRSN